MGKNWKRRIDALLSLAIIVVLLPLFITIVFQRMQLEQILYGEMHVSAVAGENGTEMAEWDAAAMEEQLIGIVAKEISANAQKQAILAQCVIARTSLCDAKERGTAEPEGLTVEEMKKLWGADFEDIYKSFKACVESTGNEVLMWNGHYIYAAYHAISAGSTRSMTEMSKKVEMPYLTEIPCGQDITAEGYVSVSYWDKTEFLEKCRPYFPGEEITDLSQISVISRDAAGYIEEIKVGQNTYFGEEFRSRFTLNSSCFTIAETDGKVRIVTKGLGHGFGLSQNTAEAMALEGKSYKEILAYFYPGTELFVPATN